MTAHDETRTQRKPRRIAVASAFALVVAATLGYVVNSALAASNPPAPSITSGPTDPTTSTSATFAFTSSQSGVNFRCSRDNAAFTACTSGITYTGLAQGSHNFRVQAFTGNQTSSNTSYTWAIVPPAPIITAGPATPTGLTSASFSFTDTQSGVGFRCALDGGSFSSCTSPKTYSGLSAGNHTFQVQAVVGSNPPSASTTRTWTVDLTAPTVAINFPADNGLYNATSWANGCSPSRMCGTATDASGVQSVGVALLQQSSNRYWNGIAFSATSVMFNNATLASPNATSTNWSYSKTVPPDGKYTVSVRGVDIFGNTGSGSAIKAVTLTIDTVAPAAPTLTSKPTNPTSSTTAEFRFTTPDKSANFSCSLDGSTPTPCQQPSDDAAFGRARYTNLAAGPHCFVVFATDPAGNVSTSTSYCWNVNGAIVPTAIAAQSGTPQSALTTTVYGSSLVAKVTGASNTPVPGVQVTFAAPSSGASGSFAACSGGNPQPNVCVVTTDANGVATASAFTANGVAGAFTVTATTAGVSTPASFSLTNYVNFTITGNIAPPLYPGTSQRIDLSITNPNPTPITLAASSVTITITTNKPGCAGSGVGGNFTATSNGVAVTVPGGMTRTLSSLGIAQTNWPLVSMLETNTNQDACKGATLTLTYNGSAVG